MFSHIEPDVSQESPWVQPIIVEKTGTHEGAVLLGAAASLAVGLENLDPAHAWRIEAWLSGPFTKTVRRASAKDLNRVRAWAEEEGFPYSLLGTDFQVLALAPMKYDDFPKCLTRLQVSGTNFLRTSEGMESQPLTIAVLEDLTTGKAVAQAAHAAWLHHLRSAPELTVPSFTVSFLGPDQLRLLAEETPHLAVFDKGLTEIEAGTLTAVAVAR